jgi:hypothetical protein
MSLMSREQCYNKCKKMSSFSHKLAQTMGKTRQASAYHTGAAVSNHAVAKAQGQTHAKGGSVAAPVDQQRPNIFLRIFSFTRH